MLNHNILTITLWLDLAELGGFGFGEPEGAVRRSLALEDTRGGFEPAATEGVFGWQEPESLSVEGAETGGGVKGECLEIPASGLDERGKKRVAGLEARGWLGSLGKVDQGRAEGVEGCGGLGDFRA